MALKNSKTGSLPVSEIYNFMTEHFPYFKVSSTGMGRGISLWAHLSAEGRRDGIPAMKRDHFLGDLYKSITHYILSWSQATQHFAPGQKGEMWGYLTKKDIKNCELRHTTVTIPHQQPIKRPNNFKNTFTASSHISNTGRTGLVASSATSSTSRLVWKERIPGDLTPSWSWDIHLGQQHPVPALYKEKCSVW